RGRKTNLKCARPASSDVQVSSPDEDPDPTAFAPPSSSVFVIVIVLVLASTTDYAISAPYFSPRSRWLLTTAGYPFFPCISPTRFVEFQYWANSPVGGTAMRTLLPPPLL